MTSQRLDHALVARGLSPTRSRARDAVKRGHVRVGERIETRPARTVPHDAPITLDDPASLYVSRAALKLVAALDAFAIDPTDRMCLDLGASTGGFTQVLLERGAVHVHAVDVGHDQFHEGLRGDPRVTLHEGLNVRDLKEDHLGTHPDLLVADVSFISLLTALPAPLDLLARPAQLAVLVKPQFEVGRDGVGKGGLVRDEGVAMASVIRVSDWLTARGWRVRGPLPSPIAGGDGNTEYLLGATHD